MSEQTEDLPMGLVITDDGSILNWQGVNYLRQDNATAIAETAVRAARAESTAVPTSKEEIAEILRNSSARLADEVIDQIADHIHVLYSHRESSGAACDSDAEIQRLTSALGAANHNYANLRDGRLNDTQQRLDAALTRIAELEALPRIDMYEPEEGITEIDGVLWVPAKDLDAMREEEEAEVQAQQTRLEALRRSHEFIAVQEPETRVSASLLLSAVRWVLTGQVDD